MNRSAEDIINKLAEYESEDAREAIAEFLIFMGIPEGTEFLAEAESIVEQQKQEERQLKREYARHLQKAGARNYISFAAFKEQRKAGRL